jgi:type II secretory pathway component PulF
MPDNSLHRIGRRLRRHWRRTWSTWATRAESGAVVRLIAAAATAGVPAAMLLDAWAEDSRGGQGTRLEKAARRLRQGATASEAIAAVPGLVQEDHAVAVAFGEQTGLLGPMVQTALAGDELLACKPGRSLRGAVGYLSFVVAMLLMVTAFLAVFIKPQLIMVLGELNGSQPALFEHWLSAVRFLEQIAWVPFAVVAVALVSRLSASLRRLLLRPFRRPRRRAAAFDLLAVAIDAGLPPCEAATTLAACHVDPRLKASLRKVASSGALGADLAAAGLVDPAEAAQIDADAASGTLVMHRIAANRRGRLGRCGQAFRETLVPAAVVMLGLLVLFQAVAVFSSLTGLIDELA